MPTSLLLDTDVIIILDYLRGRAEAASYIESQTNPFLISVVTVAELYSGVREGDERRALNTFSSVIEFVPVSAEIAVEGGLYRRDWGKSHKVGLADALIAATADCAWGRVDYAQRQTFSNVSGNRAALHEGLT